MKYTILFLILFLSLHEPISCNDPMPENEGSVSRPKCQTLLAPADDVKLRMLRVEMRNRSAVLGDALDAYILPSYDDHQSETPSNRDRRLRYLTGFSGSDGIAVITMGGAALWTDGRYVLQTDQEISCHWSIMKMEDSETPSISDWLIKQLPENARVGADPTLVPHHLWEQWDVGLSAKNILLVHVRKNLVDQLWDLDERPHLSRVQIYMHHKEFAGKPWQIKVTELRQELIKLECDAMVVTALDEIAWLLNIRGQDLPYTPVAKAYLVVTHDNLQIYVDPHKLSIEAKVSLRADTCFNANCTKVYPYDNIWSNLRTHSQAWRQVLLPSSYSFSAGVSEAIYTSVPEEKRLYIPSPIINMKAVKNPTEISGMRKAHIRDGAAMCDVLSYLEDRMLVDDHWDELKVVKVLDLTRKSQEGNRGLSFPTIAGYGPHGALPHYQPTNETTAIIMRNSTFVLDSGAQYDDGTTDVSRTLHYGTPTEEHKKAYTLVLMASIDLASLIFPADLNMNDVDIMARKNLWKYRHDYMHSTGHGIGSFLQAHESPIQIAYGQRKNIYFKPGYFFSNEPGYYKEGQFGVRLENILEVQEYTYGKHSDDGVVYLKFVDVTLVPYEPKLIDIKMLSQEQRQWLNDYNVRIRNVIGSELKHRRNMKAFYWMMNKTVLLPDLVDGANNIQVSKLFVIGMTVYIIIKNLI